METDVLQGLIELSAQSVFDDDPLDLFRSVHNSSNHDDVIVSSVCALFLLYWGPGARRTDPGCDHWFSGLWPQAGLVRFGFYVYWAWDDELGLWLEVSRVLKFVCVNVARFANSVISKLSVFFKDMLLIFVDRKHFVDLGQIYSIWISGFNNLSQRP